MLKILNYGYNVAVFCLFIGTMIFFEDLTYDEVDDINQEVILSQIQQDFVDPWTVVYGIVLSIYDSINTRIMTWFIEKRNYRYKKDYNNALTH